MTIEKVLSADGKLLRGWNIVLSPNEMRNLRLDLSWSSSSLPTVSELWSRMGTALGIEAGDLDPTNTHSEESRTAQ